MAVIRLLEQATIDKIAAGEVVERPRSVVKELTENSIDAGATAVTVEIRDGGISMVRVTDDGAGIPQDQVRTAFLRHATSKIVKVDDLTSIRSFGFRGEALSSIAAVSRVELITKTHDSLTGIRYRVEGGIETGMEEIGAPDGSTFIMRDLFYNTPARRKFLKSAQTEAGYVSEFCERLALSHPDLSVKFMVNGATKLSTSGNGKQKDVIYQIYGRDITGNLIEIDRTDEKSGMHLHGYIGKPQISRGNRTYEIFYVNGRLISSGILSKAAEEGYETFLMQHRFPFLILSLDLDGTLVDVNVHPAKAQVRFADGPGVYDFMKRTVREALTHREMIIRSTFGRDDPADAARKRAQEALKNEQAPEPFEVSRRRQLREQGHEAPASSSQPGAGTAPTAGNETGAGVTFRRQEDPDIEAGVTFRRQEDPNHSAGLTVLGNSASAAVPGNSAGLAVPGNSAGLAVPEDGQTSGQAPETVGSQAAGSQTAAAVHRSYDFSQLRSQNPVAADSPYSFKYPNVSEQRHASQARIRASRNFLDNVSEFLDSNNNFSAAEARAPYGEGEQMSLLDNSMFLTREHVKEHRLIGQVFDTYWIVQFRSSIYIIDQHAAHEKVMFERIMKRFRDKEVTSQQLSPPMIVSLSMAEEDQLRSHMDLFRSIGFEIEPFGGRDYSISAVPQDLFGMTEREFFLEMLDGMSSDTARTSVEDVTARVATMACKAAVKGNTRLSFQEADALIDELLSLDDPYNCPHGRPTIISMTRQDLEKKFKRIV